LHTPSGCGGERGPNGDCLCPGFFPRRAREIIASIRQKQVASLTAENAALRERAERAERERDLARGKAEQYERDWYAAKSEFGTATSKIREKLREQVEAHKATIKERDEARASVRIAHAPSDAVWFWEGSDRDQPESLSCPVVMSAETLRGFVDLRERAEKAELERDEAYASIGRLRDELEIANPLGTQNDPEDLRALRDQVAVLVGAFDADHGGGACSNEGILDRLHTILRELSEANDAQARIARYEAPGPAVLTIDHGLRATFKECSAKLTGTNASYEDINQGCICDAYAIAGAYREQHARDVAVFNMGADEPWPLLEVLKRLNEAAKHLLNDHVCDTHGHEGIRCAQLAAEKFIAVLTGEAEKENT
jgi:hypothetical protein